jgi:hypothetical protein
VPGEGTGASCTTHVDLPPLGTELPAVVRLDPSEPAEPPRPCAYYEEYVRRRGSEMIQFYEESDVTGDGVREALITGHSAGKPIGCCL